MRNGAGLLRRLINTGYLVRADYQQLLRVPHFARLASQVFGMLGPFNMRITLPGRSPVQPTPIQPTIPRPAPTIIPIPRIIPTPQPTPGEQS